MSGTQQLWERLSKVLEERLTSFPGVAGLCLEDLASGAQVCVNADEQFPTASTIKIHIFAHLMECAEAAEVDLQRRQVVDSKARVPGSGVLNYLYDPSDLIVRDVANLMILVSDNTATNLCIDWATISGVTEMIVRLGLTSTHLQRKMQDQLSVANGDENLSTPTEIAGILKALHSGQGLSAFVCAETLKLLKEPKRGPLVQGLPRDVVLANKPGGMDLVRNDGGIVFCPDTRTRSA